MKKTQIKLILSIFGENFLPEKLTSIISLFPTSSWLKGESVNGIKKRVIRLESCWVYEIGFIETIQFEDVSDIFVKIFLENAEILRSFLLDNKLEAKIDIIVEIFNKKAPALYFNKEFLRLTGKIEAEIDIDIYMLDND